MRQFEVFKTIIDCGSISQAANALNVSQPSVSKLLKQLEDQLGVELFSRTPRGLIPNDVAHSLYIEVVRAYSSFESLNHYASGLKELRHSRIIVSAISALSFDWMPSVVDAFLVDYPHASITVSTHNSRITRQLALSGMVDIGIAQSLGLDESVHGRRIALLDTFIIVPPGHRLASASVVRPADLVNERLILLSPDDPIRQQFEDVMQAHKIPIKSFIDVSLGATMCSLVQKNHGIGLVDSANIDAHRWRGFIALPFEPKIQMPVWMFINPASASSMIVKLFIEYILLAFDQRNVTADPTSLMHRSGISKMHGDL